MTRPLVTCAMVTRGRHALATQALACFAAQTWEPRELVVVTDRAQDAEQLRADVARRGIAGVRWIHAGGPDRPLGALRNLALDAARGEWIAQWDDDDLYAADRLAAQFAAVGLPGAREGKGDAVACYLSEQLQYFAGERSLFLVDWRNRTELASREPGWWCIPGTALFRRDVGVRYPDLPRHDDRGLLLGLLSTGAVATVSGGATLYVYRHHGGNTFEEEHWRYITRWAVGAERLAERRGEIALALAAYARFLGTDPIDIRGPDGEVAYTLTPGDD